MATFGNIPPTDPKLAALLEQARNITMTPEQEQQQAKSFVIGQMLLAHSTWSRDYVTGMVEGVMQEQQRTQDAAPIDRFLADVKIELRRAQKLYPMTGEPIKGNPNLAAMAEEACELAQAMLHIREGKTAGWGEVYQEALQLAVMASRCALEGDDTLGAYPDGH